MSELITLDEYFNRIGKELFPDWSEEAVYYYSERKKELTHLCDQAKKVYAVAINRIWQDGNVKISVRLEQGYIDPPFAIEEFDFAHSSCTTTNGYYRCKLEIPSGGQGRPIKYDINDIIRDYVQENYSSKKISTSSISGDAVISYVKDFLSKYDKEIPHSNTIRNRLLALYPECRKTSRNSKK